MSVKTEIKSNYAIVTIKRDPVNSMSLELWSELSQTLDLLETKVRGVIFTSGLTKNIFTAGNDLQELYAPKTTPERYLQFWTVSNQFLAKLYSSKLVTICAINGSCPAGGFILSLCCDFRIGTEDALMGFNETALGISVPDYWRRLLARYIGPCQADKMSQFAQMIKAREALKMGILDSIVQERDQLVSAAEEVMAKVLKIPDQGRVLTKGQARGEFSKEFGSVERLKKEAKFAWEMLSFPGTVKALDRVFANLSKPKQSKL